MERLQGIAVSSGVVIGEAMVIDNEGFRIPRRFLPRDAVDDEIQRLDRAIASATAEIAHNRERVSEQLGDQYAAIFSAHIQMLGDPRLREEVEELIQQRHYSPEYSVSRVLRRYAEIFQSLQGTYLRERVADIFDIEKRLLRHLLGERREELADITAPVLLLAHNLTPSDTANLNPKLVLGFATEIGGPGSHTAIVAEGLGIPAVVGAGTFIQEISGGETVIIDGNRGVIILRPDEPTLASYQRDIDLRKTHIEKLSRIASLPADTKDGTSITLLGNIEFPHEVEACLQRGAAGIGLYRTEFLYLAGDSEPSEEDHYEAYCKVAESLGDKAVVMRTLDLGADKVPGLPNPDDERNPFLGLRSVRLALKNVDLFRKQLRAILRASTGKNIRIMFPLISTLMELRHAKVVLGDAMEDLDEAGVPFDRNIQIGMMVEVPSAIVMLDQFADEVDFFSIGTNDLIQYVLAVDRSNKDVASLYTASEPAVLRLIKQAIDIANQRDVPISMCGQMCGNPIYTMLLIGLGLRSMSVSPVTLPEVKQVCRSVNVSECEEIASRVLQFDNARDVKTFLTEELLKRLPETPI